MRSGVDRRGSIVHNPAPKRPDVDRTPEEAPMPTPAPLAPQIEQFIHDNPQGVRDPRCSVLISHADWWSGFLVFEGTAELTHSGNTDPEALRLARRHIFSATTRRRSRDWGEYDRIAAADKRVAMVLRPDHVYGTALAKMRERWPSSRPCRSTRSPDTPENDGV
jgi:hypothetical protein